VTLWGVALVDVQSIIAQYNVRHSQEVAGHGVPLDLYYMSDLGPAAIPALDEYLTTAKFASMDQRDSFSILRGELADRVIYARVDPMDVHRFPQDWREWTWRGERLTNYLLAHPFAPDIAESID
jgi:hypothetical protein